MSRHPTPLAWARYAGRELGFWERFFFMAHLSHCPACRSRLWAMACHKATWELSAARREIARAITKNLRGLAATGRGHGPDRGRPARGPVPTAVAGALLSASALHQPGVTLQMKTGAGNTLSARRAAGYGAGASSESSGRPKAASVNPPS